MMTYTKLFTSILDSTVWQEGLEAKVVWITLLAMSDKDGKVEASVPGLARRAGVELEACEGALRRFLSPDPYSRTQEHEGRRIEEAPGGWVLLNHGKYRAMMSSEDRREYQRVKQAEYRRRRALPKGKALTNEGAAVRAEAAGDRAHADRLAAERVEYDRILPGGDPAAGKLEEGMTRVPAPVGPNSFVASPGVVPERIPLGPEEDGSED